LQSSKWFAEPIEIDEMVRLARSLGEPVAPAAAEDDINRRVEVNVIARRDEKGLDTILRAQNRPDFFRFIEEIRKGAPLPRRRVVFSYKKGLGTSDSGDIQEKAEMACKAEASRVSESLTVADDDVGPSAYFFEGLKHRGELPERKEAGYVWKCRLPLGAREFL